MDPPGKLPGEETAYVWEIENFSMCPQIKGECLKSTPFYVDSMDLSEYQLVLYPRGRSHNLDETTTCLLECLQKSHYPINVTMDVHCDDQQVKKTMNDVSLNTEEPLVVTIDLEKKPPGRFSLFPGDRLTIRCGVTPVYSDLQVYEADLKSLSEDFGHLLQTGLFSDFTLVARGGRRFPVHKLMLTTRCRELAKKSGIFDNPDCKEAMMEDVTPEVLEVFLQYVYTGRLPERLPAELLNALHTMAKDLEMDDLRRDLVPIELCTVGRTDIKVDHHDISWDIADFHERVEAGDWPVQTFLDLVVGRFVASFSIVDGEPPVAQVDLKCLCLYVERALTMKCEVKTSNQEFIRQYLCAGEHRFDEENTSKPFVMRWDHTPPHKKVGEMLDGMVLVFDLKVSHPRPFERCYKLEVINALESPYGFCQRSLHRLSSDMDIAFQDVQKLADMTVLRDGGESPIPAHRCILACRLKSDLTPETRIEGTGVEVLLRYIYSAKMSEDSDLKTVLEVYEKAKRYGLKSLASRCLKLFGGTERPEDPGFHVG